MTTDSTALPDALTFTRPPKVVGVVAMKLSLKTLGEACTVQVVYSTYEENDAVVVDWFSNEDGENYQASNPTNNAGKLEFSIPLDVVKANIGFAVVVTYTVTRGEQSGTSSGAILRVTE